MGLLSGILGGGGGSAPSATNTQNTATTSGYGVSAQGSKNTLGNTTTSATTKNANKVTTGNTTVSAKGNIAYNTYGVTAADVATIGTALSGATGSGGSGFGPMIVTTPSPGVTAALGNTSTIKWGLFAVIAAVGFGIYFFFFRNKS